MMDSSLCLVTKANPATRTKEEISFCGPWPFLLRTPNDTRISTLSQYVLFEGFLHFGISSHRPYDESSLRKGPLIPMIMTNLFDAGFARAVGPDDTTSHS